MIHFTFLLISLVLSCSFLFAQPTINDFKDHPGLSGGFLATYPIPDTSKCITKESVPKGYVPFYISHYGRHGSRFLDSEWSYNHAIEILQNAKKQACLTDSGENLLKKLILAGNAINGRAGDLSSRGVREHKGIARRMYNAYPEVFTSSDDNPVYIDCRSTNVVRCVLSMSAFSESLKELEPKLHITRTSSVRDMSYLANDKGYQMCKNDTQAVGDSLRSTWLKPNRFFSNLISNPDFIKDEIKDPQVEMYRLFKIAVDLDCTDLQELSMYEFFTPEELWELWHYVNAYIYVKNGPSEAFGKYFMSDARPLLENIVNTAQQVIDGNLSLAASFRFGHDKNLIPLLYLTGVECARSVVSLEEVHNYWNLSEVSPMAANLQFIFFRNKKGNVLVRVLHNEKDASLPLPGGPFYSWKILKNYLLNNNTK